jgi:CRISPR-associated protein Cas1
MRPHSQILIAPTKRTQVVFLENASVEISSGSLVYRRSGNGEFSDYNIPYANTSLILIGNDVQISQESIRRLSDSGVMVCLCGHNGDSKNVQFIEPQVEHRTDHYMKKWSSIFIDDSRSMTTAKRLLKERVQFTKAMWEVLPQAADYGLYSEEIKPEISVLMKIVNDKLTTESGTLLKAKNQFEKSVYGVAAPLYGFNEERRPGSSFDISNRYLDIANYVAYGYAAIALHGMAIPFSFSVIHGRTGRSGLVHDLAGLLIDSVCLPVALDSAASGRDEDEMCLAIRLAMQEHDVLDYLFKTVKTLCEM